MCPYLGIHTRAWMWSHDSHWSGHSGWARPWRCRDRRKRRSPSSQRSSPRPAAPWQSPRASRTHWWSHARQTCPRWWTRWRSSRRGPPRSSRLVQAQDLGTKEEQIKTSDLDSKNTFVISALSSRHFMQSSTVSKLTITVASTFPGCPLTRHT